MAALGAGTDYAEGAKMGTNRPTKKSAKAAKLATPKNTARSGGVVQALNFCKKLLGMTPLEGAKFINETMPVNLAARRSVGFADFPKGTRTITTDETNGKIGVKFEPWEESLFKTPARKKRKTVIGSAR